MQTAADARSWPYAGALILALAGAGTAEADPGVVIDLVFEPGVAETLASRGEWVVVRAWYHGEPVNASVPVDEMGLVYLGEEEGTVFPGNQRVVLGGAMAAQPRSWVVEPLINVNTYSARFSDDYNLLDCGIIEGPVTALAGQVQKISCKLLGAP